MSYIKNDNPQRLPASDEPASSNEPASSDEPTARELLDGLNYGVRIVGSEPDGLTKDDALELTGTLADRVVAVLALHKPMAPGTSWNWCGHCHSGAGPFNHYPCETVRLLNVEKL
jgi:hypothetical protein